jgi:NitT/TauT family transport system ATP-binding protein
VADPVTERPATAARQPGADAPPGAPKIEARGIRKVFSSRRGEVTAIDGVDFSASAGEFVSIVGPSGCGKSTFLYIVGGFVDATEGTVVVDGSPITGPDPARGIVFQEFVLFPWKTVMGNVTYGLAEQGVPRSERRERARQLIETVKLTGFERHFPKELSGGMKQRVALARTLIMDPDILLMDEPFGALDAQTRTVLQEEVSRLRSVMNYTVMFITHSVEEAVYLGDRVVVMSSRPGRIKRIINIPRDAEWRGLEIEEAGNHASFIDAKREIWELIRAEIVRQ